MSLNLTSEDEVTFRCVHAHTSNISWSINGTFSDVYLPPNTTVISNSIGSDGVSSSVNFLSCHNNTILHCLAYFEEDLYEESPQALMKCQG